MLVRKAKLSDIDRVLTLLDKFREDCILQISGKQAESYTARSGGKSIYRKLIESEDYVSFVLESSQNGLVGIITGYLCPMLRIGDYRAEVEEFFVRQQFRGGENAKNLMDNFISWAKEAGAVKINLESDNELARAHQFYEKYGFESKAKRYLIKIPTK